MVVAVAGLAIAQPCLGRVAAPASPALGDRQSAILSQRLDAIAERIERQRRSGSLSAGPATFMQQDLSRIRSGVEATLNMQAALSQQEMASYSAMIRRVELRLMQAEARCTVAYRPH